MPTQAAIILANFISKTGKKLAPTQIFFKFQSIDSGSTYARVLSIELPKEHMDFIMKQHSVA